jgi:hypothetical protein
MSTRVRLEGMSGIRLRRQALLISHFDSPDDDTSKHTEHAQTCNCWKLEDVQDAQPGG